MKTVKYTKLLLILSSVLSLVAPAKAQSTAAEVITPIQLNLMPVPASVQTQTGREAQCDLRFFSHRREAQLTGANCWPSHL